MRLDVRIVADEADALGDRLFGGFNEGLNFLTALIVEELDVDFALSQQFFDVGVGRFGLGNEIDDFLEGLLRGGGFDGGPEVTHAGRSGCALCGIFLHRMMR